MELFKSLETRVKIFTNPFKHFEINQPLTNNAIEEIAKADIMFLIIVNSIQFFLKCL